MARLRHQASGREHEVEARCLIGRSPPCQLLVDEPLVSGVHAELAWDGDGWALHDLDSSNGTYVAGRRLTAGERAKLEVGTVLAFGNRERGFVLVDASAPRLVAKAADGRVAVAETSLLSLPNEDDPEVTIMLGADGRWVAEGAEVARPIDDFDAVIAGGAVWLVHLPKVVSGTRALIDEVLTLRTITLELTVSRDEEHVSCVMRHGATEVELISRAHAFLLLRLARDRMADVEQGLGPAEQGWRHRDELCQKLGIDNQLLNLWVYRARRQLVQAGVVDATRVIERRAGSQQLRLGVAQVEIRSTE
ncbi:FHA domain-containing protein [Paraliomyxa miuraensis]|uniref:FHA domain-containing protein n=1 Tax=Paraliomyxa miuraensis TaxID=376150 RepID=UPI00224F0592|nr:FHA domain-containing protein [Paraliomyxa miuraensis]MCX4244160.1 FHA domain-containing protein [Paraliomyxa miuraensis]